MTEPTSTDLPAPVTRVTAVVPRELRCLGGRFALLDHIGAGGGAVVVRARDRQFPGRQVAIKLLRSRDEDLRRRFVQEAEVLRAVDHPSIVRVFGRDIDGEEYYTVLELIEGADLLEHLTHSGPLPWRQVVDLGIQIASALEMVHRQGLVHRDVKPANIMLDAVGRVKLIDFGVVRITENYRVPTGATQRRPTDNGKALGTPGYLPLEAGLTAPNPSFDVFGLGATLYQLVTGKIPEEPLEPLCAAHPGCDAPADLERVLLAALALEPEDRTQSAEELGRALAAVRRAHPERGTSATRIDGRYELIGLAGTGAKGEAHRAVHRGAGHDVVLKFLRSTEPDDALRFAREAKVLQTFNHPSLPRFYDYAPEATPPYIVMAPAPGQLAGRLCSPPRLKPTEVAAVGVKLARVLAMVHARGVLHRDINASNVLIDANGGVTLLDFGCAELCEKFYDVPAGERRYLTPPEARVSIPDGGIGKLAWSAPEVSGGKGWTDRSDVYSMGHLLFRLMTGTAPKKGADPPTSILALVVTCPEGVAMAIEGALQVDPQARPSAAQLAQELTDVLEAEEQEFFARVMAKATPAARPPLRLVPAAPEAPTDWTQRPIPDASSQSALSAELAEPPPTGPAVANAPGRSRIALVGAALVTLVALVVTWWATHRPSDRLANVAEAPGGSFKEDMLEVPAQAASTPSSPPPMLAPESDTTPSTRVPPSSVGSAADLLTAADPALTECARKAGRKVWVELKTSKGEPRFTTLDIIGDDTEGCARRVLEQIQFAPPDRAGALVKEYEP
jgi:serine/threonine protein kinase